jgi:sulfite reductase flavoprotein, alpha component
MASKLRSGLGRGLDSLISVSGSLNDLGEHLRSIDITKIQPSRYQARTQIAEQSLQELADSIKIQGIIQPIVVREIGLDQYELIAGERRWRAAQLVGLTEIPAIVKQMNDKTVMAVGLIENIQRENLNVIEEARGFCRLIDEFGLTHEQIAEAVGRSRSAISNSLRLLKLPEPIQNLLYENKLEMGHARALLSLSVDKQLELANKAIQNAWSVREMEKRSQNQQAHQPHIAAKNINPDVIRLSEALTEQLGLMAEIKTRDNKKGKIVLHFSSVQEFQGIMQKLNIEI